MSTNRISLPSVPHNTDRNLTLFLQQIKVAVETVAKNGGGTSLDQESIEYLNRAIRRNTLSVNDEIRDKIEAALGVGNLLTILNGSITESQLFADLTSRINKITVNETAISAETQARLASLLAVNNTITSEQNARIAAIQATKEGITTEINKLKAVDSATNSRLDSVIATTSDNFAGVQTDIQTVTNETTALGFRIDSVVATTLDNTALITNETQARTTANTAMSNRISALVVESGDSSSAAIIDEATARSDADDALGTRIDIVSAKTNANTASILTEKTATTTALTSVTQQLNVVVAKSNANAGLIVDERNARTTAISAQADQLSAVEAKADSSAARVGVLETADVTNKSALATAKTELRAEFTTGIDTATTNITANTAAINNESVARSSALTAVSNTINTIQTTLNGNTASVQTAQSAIDGINAKWSIKTDVNGVVGGLAIENTGATVDFIISASKFSFVGINGSKSTPFTIVPDPIYINGTYMPAGNYLDAAYIRFASIDTLQIKGDAVTVPRFSFNPNSVSVTNHNTEMLIGSLSINTDNGSASISVGFEKIDGTFQEPYASGDTGYIEIVVRCNSRLVRSYQIYRSDKVDSRSTGSNSSVIATRSIWSYTFLNLPSIIDYPGNSNVTYNIYIKTVNFTGANRSLVLKGISFQVMGNKR